MTARKRQAFSLVEIALALGLVSFGCIAIFGLLGATATTSRRSSEETAIAAMSRQIISSIKQQEFAAIETSLAGKTTNYFFDPYGNPLPSVMSAQYQCAVTGTADVSTTSSFPDGKTQVNLVRLQLVFTWPLNGTPANTNIIITSAAR